MQVFLLYTFTGHTLSICRSELPEPKGAALLVKRDVDCLLLRVRHRLDCFPIMKLLSFMFSPKRLLLLLLLVLRGLANDTAVSKYRRALDLIRALSCPLRSELILCSSIMSFRWY